MSIKNNWHEISFGWNYWAKQFFYIQGVLSFIGANLYSLGQKYDNARLLNYGLLFWMTFAALLQLFLMFYCIINAGLIVTKIKVKALSILYLVQPQKTTTKKE